MIRNILAFATAVFAATAAPAAPIFLDDFDGYGTGRLNWDGGGNWTVTSGSVDLIPLDPSDPDAGQGAYNSVFELFPGNGRYVDLDGTSWNAGVFSTNMSFAPGGYAVAFALGGNRRHDFNGPDVVTVLLGDWTETFTVAWDAPLVTFTRTVSTNTAGPLRFSNAGGDNEGATLAFVSVSPNASHMPEPATIAVFGGLAMAGAAGCRRRTKATA